MFNGLEKGVLKNRSTALLALLSGVVLITSLIPVPLPGFLTGLPWKSELTSSLLIFGFLIWLLRHWHDRLLSAFDNGEQSLYAAITATIGLFILWSAISGTWA